MGPHWRRIASWAFGICTLVAVIWTVGGLDMDGVLKLLSGHIVASWVALTVLIRLLQVEVLVRPVHALGGSLPRLQAFWLSWARTFLNQVIPMSGMAYYAAFMRQRSGMAWGYIGALAYPQFVLSLTASALFGTIVTPLALDMNQPLHWLILSSFGMLLAGGVLLVWGSPRVMPFVAGWAPKLLTAHQGIIKLNEKTHLVPLLFGLHFLGVLLRASRLYLIFSAFIDQTPIIGTAFLSALGETGFLLQLTPGGIGIRELAVTGAAMIEGTSPELALTVAVADRALIILVTALMALPAFWCLRNKVHAPKQ